MRSFILGCGLIGLVLGQMGPMGGGGWHRRPAYPPEFENVLPEAAKAQLRQIHANQQLSWDERRNQMDEVFDSLSPSIIARLPFPQMFTKFSPEIVSQLQAIHSTPNLRWSERRERVHSVLDNVPWNERRAAFHSSFFPQTPPPGYETVLSPTIYSQLMQIHSNTQMPVEEKKSRVDRIMRLVPKEQIDRLPLPPPFLRLPLATQSAVRSILHDYTVPWDERHRKLREFTHSLPSDVRKAMRPPLPPFVQNLPPQYREQLQAIHDNENLHHRERFQQIRQILESLPEELKSQIPPMGFGGQRGFGFGRQ